MSSRLQITCVRKARRNGDRQQWIQSIDGAGWNHAEQEAISYIDEDIYSYYIKRKGEVVDIIVAERAGRKYLKTMLDVDQPDNLFDLPECPEDKTSHSVSTEDHASPPLNCTTIHHHKSLLPSSLSFPGSSLPQLVGQMYRSITRFAREVC